MIHVVTITVIHIVSHGYAMLPCICYNILLIIHNTIYIYICIYTHIRTHLSLYIYTYIHIHVQYYDIVFTSISFTVNLIRRRVADAVRRNAKYRNDNNNQIVYYYYYC